MATIHEPISEWSITVTVLVTPDEPHDPLIVFNTIEFKTLAMLREYFLSQYSFAKSLGYRLTQKPRLGEDNERLVGRLGFEYRDRFTHPKMEFKSVDDFVRFLKAHPALATAVEYVQKH
ncbi:hypothetical protein [Chryseolinea soli]|uniref:Uncharacterized protein n=1 Tax=Chryseolinea soli TaxID=2321403 RepID=A0A385SXE3_9BACT|nr:hypothetical protein [Chryseolinea soli]AYB35306.1 hypothetical protein D4L85_34070 [Chryseolinea soli]